MKLGLHNQTISAQTVRDRLREAHLCARPPHQGLELTAVQRCTRFQWANTQLQRPLAHWRSVLFTHESWFQLYRADGRQRVYGGVWASSLQMSTL